MALMRGVPEARAYDVVPGGVIWTEFLQLVLERARSAREGAALVGELCGRYGLSCDSGTMVAVADPREAWWVELARDGQWAAQRVGPDEVAMRANCYRIREVDFADPESFMFSPTLVEHARERGFYRDGPFDFAAVYGDPANQEDAYNLDRHRACDGRLSGLETVAVPDLLRFLRDVYEGTPLHKTRPDGSPFRTGVRTIARMNTEASSVLVPRPELPPHVGHLMWCSLSTSLTGVYLPFHLGIEASSRTSPRPPPATTRAPPTGCSRSWRSSPTTATRAASTSSPRPGGTSRPRPPPPCPGSRPARPASRSARRARCSRSSTGRRAEAAIETLERLLPEVKTRVFREEF